MESSAQIVARYRTEAGMSQDDVAVALGITAGAVSQWENGRTHPSRARAVRLDKLFGASGQLLAALGYVSPEDRAEEITMLRELVESQGKELRRLAARVSKLTGDVAALRGDQPRSQRSR